MTPDPTWWSGDRFRAVRLPELAAAPALDEQVLDGLSVTEAGELLDWLENHGVRHREVQVTADGRMTVRWAA